MSDAHSADCESVDTVSKQRVRPAGAYIVKCASTRSGPPPRMPLPADWTPPVPSEGDRSLIRALLRLKGRS